MKSAKKQEVKVSELKTNEKKWTKDLWNSGWTGIPTVIIERQQKLGLDEPDINILLHIISYWWKSEDKPWPSKVTIAKAMKRNPRTIQKRIAQIEKDKLIRREYRGGESGKGSKSNLYHLEGLIKAALPLAAEKVAKAAERRAVLAAAAKNKGKSKFKVVEIDE